MILLILITFSLDYVWLLLGENWCWPLLRLKGLRDTSVKWTPWLVHAFLYSFYLNHYKVDISWRRMPSAGPKSIHVRETWLYLFLISVNYNSGALAFCSKGVVFNGFDWHCSLFYFQSVHHFHVVRHPVQLCNAPSLLMINLSFMRP